MLLPDIGLTSTKGGTVNLSRLEGWTVIFCYPWTGRPGLENPPDWDDIAWAHGSTPQAEGYRNCRERFSAANVSVFGLSLQDTSYQAELADRLGLGMALLSDAQCHFSKAMQLETFATGGVNYLKRTTLIANGRTVLHVRTAISKPAEDAFDVLSWLESNQ